LRETTPNRVARSSGMGARRRIDLEYSGLRALDINRLAQIADKLDVSIDWVLSLTDEPEIPKRAPFRSGVELALLPSGPRNFSPSQTKHW
jgi:hypothetical protein